uniref:MCF.2 cell line derived transforming sequence n=1 Tax=Fundulus heteroclitus TaxID=8078 RepID=A0A3Q2Q0C9_FUNHE
MCARLCRQSIETFAVTVKEIAQQLQGFGSELSETELPDEANAIEFLLHSHTHRYRQMKVIFNFIHAECLFGGLCALVCFRLLAQLRDMEEAFDGFFEKHHLKLQQYLQLLHYETSFQQVLERLSAQEKEIASVGTTVVQTEQLLKDLESLNKRVVILHGHQLAANHHYALALIVQRCNELLDQFRKQALRWCDEGAYLLASQMVDKFQTKEGAQEALQYLGSHQERAPSVLKNSQDTLSLEFEAVLTPQLQVAVCTSVQCMIRNREQCLKKLADLQVRPIQLVAPRPEPDQTLLRCKSPLFSPKHGNRHFKDFQIIKSIFYGFSIEDLRQFISLFYCFRHIMKELIATERVYVDELLSVLLVRFICFAYPSMSYLLPSALRCQKDVLFGNMPEIYQFHSRIFLQDLQGCLETPERVGACFLRRKDKFQVYERYCQNKPCSELLWRQCSDSPFFQECQKKLDHKLGLDSYLLKPIQRLTKYQLLLKELLKHCVEAQYRCELQEALDSMLELLKSVNDSMHQIAITGYPGDISQLGRIILQGSFSVWISHKRAAVRMKELARFKPMQRHLFLYEHALLFCKRRDEDSHDSFYSFKSCLRMSTVAITETVKGDVKKFEICYSGREVVYIVQAPTVEVKVAWLNEIQKILANPQKLRQGFYHLCGLVKSVRIHLNKILI